MWTSCFLSFYICFCCKVWEKTAGVKVIAAAKYDHETFSQKAENIVKEAPSVQHVGFIGLGAMGFGMASTLCGDMDASRATILLTEKFIDYGVHAYEPRLVRCDRFGGCIRILVHKLKRK